MDFKDLLTVHSGKMSDIPSISTSPFENGRCLARHNTPGTICKHCYSIKLLRLRPALAEKLKKNTALLTACTLTESDIKKVNHTVFRFEAFEDLVNTVQFNNYCTIAKCNPQTTFTLWTKNPDIIKKAILEGTKKPDNMILIYSSPVLNRGRKMADIKAKWPFFDKSFTVYDKTTAKRKKININCGGKSCLDCMLCYTKNNTFYVNEILK